MEQRKRIREAASEAIETDESEDKFYGEDKTGDELPEDIQGQKKRLEKIKHALNKANHENEEKINITDMDANFMKDKQSIQTNYNYQSDSPLSLFPYFLSV